MSLPDLSRDEVSEAAKAVLVGNAYRLRPPDERIRDYFTPKCVLAAGITNTALIRSCDLFVVAKLLIDQPNPSFAAMCRQAIVEASGETVRFPELDEVG